MKIRSYFSIAAALCLAIVSVGCGAANTNTTANNARAANTTNTASTTYANTAGTTAADTTASTSDAPDTGVAECDDYIKKYEACLTKVAKQNPQAEATMRTAFKAQRDGFKTAAANPQAKATLATQCKQAVETAKASMTVYACEW